VRSLVTLSRLTSEVRAYTRNMAVDAVDMAEMVEEDLFTPGLRRAQEDVTDIDTGKAHSRSCWFQSKV